MKIAILNWRDLGHPDSGGAEIFIHEVGTNWAQMGHEVTVFSSRARGLPIRDSADGIGINRVGHLKTASHHYAAPRAIKAEGRFDVVLESINTIPYFLPWRGLPTPFASLVHQMARDVWRAHLPTPIAIVAQSVEPHFYHSYKNRPILAVSNSTKTDLIAAGVKNVTVVPQGGVGRQSHLPHKETNPTFIFVGRLSPNKRPDHAVEAFRLIRQRIPNARLWIVGDGEMRPSLASSLPDGAELLGRLPRDELLDRMGRAHLLLATSVREGWGLVVTEANALGTPAVAYDVPGLRDSIRDGRTGLLSATNSRSLAALAVQTIQRPSLYHPMRNHAQAWGAERSWNVTASMILAKLVTLANHGGTGIDRG